MGKCETLSEKTHLNSEPKEKQQCNIEIWFQGQFRKYNYKVNCLRDVEFRFWVTYNEYLVKYYLCGTIEP